MVYTNNLEGKDIVIFLVQQVLLTTDCCKKMRRLQLKNKINEISFFLF